MKKLLSIILGAAMLSAFVLSTGCSSKGDFHVGIVQLVDHTALDSANEGFRDELTKLMEAAGKTVTFDNQSAQNNASTANDIANKFVNRNVDLILSIATGATTAAVNATAAKKSDIPVLFTAVTDPVGEKFVQSMEQPGGNVSGTTDMNPVAKQLALLKTLLPEGATKVGIIYNPGETNSVAQANIAKAAAASLGLTVEEGLAPTIDTVSSVFNTIASKVDGIYLPTDNLIANAAATIHAANLQLAQSNKAVPIVAGESGINDKCGIATYGGIDYNELGKQTARMAFKILMEGEAVSSMAVQAQEGSSELELNEQVAEELGIVIPEKTRAFQG